MKFSASLLFGLIWLLLLGAAQAQDLMMTEADQSTAPAELPTSSPPAASLASPRATMDSFLIAMNLVKEGNGTSLQDALATMDLSGVNALVRNERGVDLAWMLLEVIDRTRFVEIDKIPLEPEQSPWIFEPYGRYRVAIGRQHDGSWLFDQTTIQQLPEILASVQDRARVVGGEVDSIHRPWHLRIREQLPTTLKQAPFLLENWRWLGLLLIVAVGVIIDRVVVIMLRRMTTRWLKKHPKQIFDDVSDDLLRPLGLMAMALIWWAGINLLGLPEAALLILLIAVKFLASAAGVWAAYRLVDLVSALLIAHAEGTANRIDDVLVPLVIRTLKIFVTVIGLVFIADNLNIDVSGLLAGLGLGGLAFALAAKDMVQNLFGSITVLLDGTFSVGDWIKVDDQEGTVERMGFRSTRIRTFYNSMLTVPNSRFITASVDNMGERRYRRLSTQFGIAYDTQPERIEAFCEGIRELVRQHPYMRKDYYHVYLNGLGASSLEILVYVFWETPDWATELRERHRFLLDCLRLAKRLEIEYAFPTQTLYLRNQDGGAAGGDVMALDKASGIGREQAQAIVRDTGLEGTPPPERF